MKALTLIFGLTATLLLAGCGQKGDLYLTEDTPPPTLEKAQADQYKDKKDEAKSD